MSDKDNLQNGEIIYPALAHIVLRNPKNKRMKPIGTAFVISMLDPNRMLLMTARHNLSWASEIDSKPPKSAVTSLFSVPTPYKKTIGEPDGYEWLVMINRVVDFSDKEEVISHAIEAEIFEAYSSEYTDIAYIKAVSKIPIGEWQHLNETLHTAMPAEGTKVSAIGFHRTADLTGYIECEEFPSGEGEIRNALWFATSMSNGVVEAVYPNGKNHIGWPCFQVSFPFHSGMSGGPVVTIQDGKTVCCGVICSSRTRGDGSIEDSVASALWPSLMTPIQETGYSFTLREGPPGPAKGRVLGLIQDGHIRDVSDAPQSLKVAIDPMAMFFGRGEGFHLSWNA